MALTPPVVVLEMFLLLRIDLCVDDLFSTDHQAGRVLPAAGPSREAGEGQEEAGQEATVHAPRLLGTLLSLSTILSSLL